MIRFHLLLILAFWQTVLDERLVIAMPTGGRGLVSPAKVVEPLISLSLVVIPYRSVLKRMIWNPTVLLTWGPFLILSVVLPVLGILFTGFPIRTLFGSWNALLPLVFLSFGCLGAVQGARGKRVAATYFLLAILAQLGMAVIQTLGQSGALPGLLQGIYEWDFRFKALHQPKNVILGRATGFYLNPNYLGVWGLMAFWISVVLLKGRMRWVGAVSAFLTILLCQSRGSLAAWLVSSAVYFGVWWFRDAERRQRLKAGLAGVALAIPVMVLLLPGLAASVGEGLRNVPVVGHALERYVSGAKVLSEGAGADVNFRGRTQYWSTVFEFLKQNPFGSLGSPEMVTGVPADNQYVAIVGQGSFYYLAAFGMVCIGGLIWFGRGGPASRLLGVATLAMMINGVSAVPFIYSASLNYWILVGLHLAERAGIAEEAA